MKTTEKLGFNITDSKGFHIKFDNGYVVSVQFGQYNYCFNYNTRDSEPLKNNNGIESAND